MIFFVLLVLRNTYLIMILADTYRLKFVILVAKSTEATGVGHCCRRTKLQVNSFTTVAKCWLNLNTVWEHHPFNFSMTNNIIIVINTYLVDFVTDH